MSVKKLTFTAFLLTLAITLSFMESLFPTLPFMPPGVKLGLSNIVTMYTLFTVDKPSAFMLNTLKSVFVFTQRGAIAAALSFTGGIVSLGVMILLHKILKDRISYLSLSAAGAVFHNLGQFVCIVLLFDDKAVLWYIPVLIVSGVIMGCVTGTVVNTVMPRLGLIKGEENA